MARRQVDLKKVFLPSDSIAFIVIAIGLFIALFLDEMAVRLIGVCIAVLGGVALFMMVSPRLTDLSVSRPPRPTESPSFRSETRKDALSTSQVFDSQAYRETFGGDEGTDAPPFDERQIELFPMALQEPSQAEGPSQAAGPSQAEGPSQAAGPSQAPSQEPSPSLGDGVSSVRIIGKKKTSAAAEPTLLIRNRETRGIAELRGEVKEVQLSEDVIIRPKTVAANSEQPVASSESPEVSSEQPVVSSEQPVVSSEQPVASSESEETSIEEPPTTDHQPPTTDHQPAKRRKSEISLSAFIADVDEEMESSEEPRKEFDYLLNRVLMVIRSATTARTAAFFWYNRDKQQLVLEAKITDALEDFTDHRKLPIGLDVVSQIAKEGRPQILTDISPAAELDLLPYYKYKAGTSSFVGVPVYYKGNVVGVLCADAKEEDAYTDVTVGFFGHFTKLISGLVQSYTSKFDLQQSARLLEASQQFRAALAEDDLSTTSIIESLFDVIVRQMQVSTIGICMFDRAKQSWTITEGQSMMPTFDDLIGASIDINSSVVGQAIRNGEMISVPAASAGVRYAANEHELTSGQFVAIPLRSARRTHGALFIENHEGTISTQDLLIAESLGDHAGQEIENLRTVERLETGSIIDPDTGVLNTDGFIMRVREEFARATDYQMDLSVCLIRIDPARATSGTDNSVQLALLQHVLGRVRALIREYDVIGRYDDDVIAVGLVGYASQEAQFWTENLRRDVASSAVNIDGKRLAATISVGVAEASPRETWQTVLENAATALEISSRAQNKVTLFS